MKYPALFALALSSVAVIAVVAFAERYAHHFEAENERATAPSFFPQKMTGSALQKLAFKLPHYLPIYGSSELGSYELQQQVQAKAGDFFLQSPTGFMVFPVGRGGTTPLVTLQEIAAVGSWTRGHKVVIIISPNWFSRPFSAIQYAGNTTPLHTGSMIFGPYSQRLKMDIAKRLQQFPEPLAHSDLLRLETNLYASGGAWQKFLAQCLTPVGRTWLSCLRIMDDVITVKELIALKQNHLLQPAPLLRRNVHWAKELANSEATSNRQAMNATAGLEDPAAPLLGPLRASASPVDIYSASVVWGDYDLLLRVLHESGAQAMILSVPMDGSASDERVPFGVREIYYNKLRNMAAAYGYPCFTFEEHEYDGNFLIQHGSHLTEKGWLYFDQMIDAFYHNRIGANSSH